MPVMMIFPRKRAIKNFTILYPDTPKGTYNISSGSGSAAKRNTAKNNPLLAIASNSRPEHG